MSQSNSNNARRTQSLDTPLRQPRSKNYSLAECEVLLQICDKYKSILNVNTSRDKVTNVQTKTWAKITKEYNTLCRAEGFVSSTYFSLVMKYFHI